MAQLPPFDSVFDPVTGKLDEQGLAAAWEILMQVCEDLENLKASGAGGNPLRIGRFQLRDRFPQRDDLVAEFQTGGTVYIIRTGLAKGTL